MNARWKWSNEARSWLIGTPEIGAGVGTCLRGWDGLLVLGGAMTRIGPFDDLEAAQHEAESRIVEYCRASGVDLPQETT